MTPFMEEAGMTQLLEERELILFMEEKVTIL